MFNETTAFGFARLPNELLSFRYCFLIFFIIENYLCYITYMSYLIT